VAHLNAIGKPLRPAKEKESASCLTGEPSRHRVPATFTSLRPATPSRDIFWPGQSHAEVVVGSETAILAVPIDTRTIQKLRLRILPYLFLLYVICYLDRINIGFAALTMNKELAITSQQFGLLAGIFFFGYFLFEVPSNLLLHRIGARI